MLLLNETVGTAFDTDIDEQFNEAKRIYVDILKLDGEGFLERKPEDRVHYGDDDDDEEDGDKIIDDLEKKMVINEGDILYKKEEEKQGEMNEAAVKNDNKMLDDLLDELMN